MNIKLQMSGYLLAFIILIGLTLLLSINCPKKERVTGSSVPIKGISEIFSPRAGMLSHIFKKEGDEVSGGNLLFTIKFLLPIHSTRNENLFILLFAANVFSVNHNVVCLHCIQVKL